MSPFEEAAWIAAGLTGIVGTIGIVSTILAIKTGARTTPCQIRYDRETEKRDARLTRETSTTDAAV